MRSFFLAAAVVAAAAAPTSRARSAEKMLRFEITVPAPRAEVWKAFATSEGLSTWLAPNSNVELRKAVLAGIRRRSSSKSMSPTATPAAPLVASEHAYSPC